VSGHDRLEPGACRGDGAVGPAATRVGGGVPGSPGWCEGDGAEPVGCHRGHAPGCPWGPVAGAGVARGQPRDVAH
jgi:hypothetical protein